MESIIYVAEASALMESIHTLKQWLYDGTIQLLIPTCTLHIVEEALKASVAAKDAPKQQQSARHVGGRAKKEYPLFDINPRTAWEFLERVRSGNDTVGVVFQQEGEVFTQWKKEEVQEVTKKELSLPPPSSFADALLRKLVVKEDAKDGKGPTKPKLTARPKENKSAWKIDKVPTFSAGGLSETNKSLLSCILWRVHEAEKNPLQPVRYRLLVNNLELESLATRFDLAAVNINLLKAERTKQKRDSDVRNAKGLLEQDFPEIMALSSAFIPEDDIGVDSTSGALGFLDLPSNTNDASHLHTEEHVDPEKANGIIDTIPIALTEPMSNLVNHQKDSHETQREDEHNTSPLPATPEVDAQIQDILQNTEQTVLSSAPLGIMQGPDNGVKQDTEFDSDIDSDDEIIVFNPRNRRASGPLSSQSRPGSSGGFVSKVYKAGIQTSSNLVAPLTPLSINGQTFTRDVDGKNDPSSLATPIINHTNVTTPVSALAIKPPMEFKLKAESPVFTPGMPVVPGPVNASNTMLSLQNLNTSIPLTPTGPRNTLPRHQRGGIMANPSSNELLRIQKESSHRMIQRQREAIQRQSRATDTQPVQTPASPRLIQMEPTDNPTVIDPDAFDRTYIVQPPSSGTSTTLRPVSQKRHGRGNHQRNTVKDRSRKSEQAIDPDADSNVGAGASRISARGKGKLWVP